MADLDLDAIEAAHERDCAYCVPGRQCRTAALVAALREARTAIARVRALHVPEWVVIDYVGGSVCRECREPVESEPCATIRALDGDPSTTTVVARVEET